MYHSNFSVYELEQEVDSLSSHDGKFIVAGSENQCIYIWKTHHDYSKFSSARRDRNLYWEGVKGTVMQCIGDNYLHHWIISPATSLL